MGRRGHSVSASHTKTRRSPRLRGQAVARQEGTSTFAEPVSSEDHVDPSSDKYEDNPVVRRLRSLSSRQTSPSLSFRKRKAVPSKDLGKSEQSMTKTVKRGNRRPESSSQYSGRKKRRTEESDVEEIDDEWMEYMNNILLSPSPPLTREKDGGSAGDTGSAGTAETIDDATQVCGNGEDDGLSQRGNYNVDILDGEKMASDVDSDDINFSHDAETAGNGCAASTNDPYIPILHNLDDLKNVINLAGLDDDKDVSDAFGSQGVESQDDHLDAIANQAIEISDDDSSEDGDEDYMPDDGDGDYMPEDGDEDYMPEEHEPIDNVGKRLESSKGWQSRGSVDLGQSSEAAEPQDSRAENDQYTHPSSEGPASTEMPTAVMPEWTLEISSPENDAQTDRAPTKSPKAVHFSPEVVVRSFHGNSYDDGQDRLEAAPAMEAAAVHPASQSDPSHRRTRRAKPTRAGWATTWGPNRHTSPSLLQTPTRQRPLNVASLPDHGMGESQQQNPVNSALDQSVYMPGSSPAESSIYTPPSHTDNSIALSPSSAAEAPITATVDTSSVEALKLAMGGIGWAGNDDQWKMQSFPVEPGRPELVSLWQILVGVLRLIRDIPVIADGADQEQYLAQNDGTLKRALHEADKNIKHIFESHLEAPPGESRPDRAEIVEQVAGSIIPLLVLTLTKVFMTGGAAHDGNYNVLLPPTGDFSLYMLRLAERLFNWLERLALTVTAEDNEVAAGKRRNRRAVGKKLDLVANTIAGALERVMTRIKYKRDEPIRRERATVKEKQMREYRDEKTRAEGEETADQLLRCLKSIATVQQPTETQARGKRQTNFGGDSRTPVAEDEVWHEIRDWDESESAVEALQEQAEALPKESPQSPWPAWTAPDNQMLLNVLQNTWDPDLSTVARQLGRQTRDVFLQAVVLKRAAITGFGKLGRRPPSWSLR